MSVLTTTEKASYDAAVAKLANVSGGTDHLDLGGMQLSNVGAPDAIQDVARLAETEDDMCWGIALAPASTVVKYMQRSAGLNVVVAEAGATYPVGRPRIFRAMRVWGGISHIPNNEGFTITLRKNGIDTTLSLAVPANAAGQSFTLTDQAVAVAAGDSLSMSITQGGSSTQSNFYASVTVN